MPGAAISKWVSAISASTVATGLPSGMWAITRWGAPRQTGSSPASHAATSEGIYPLIGWPLPFNVFIQSMVRPASHRTSFGS